MSGLSDEDQQQTLTRKPPEALPGSIEENFLYLMTRISAEEVKMMAMIRCGRCGKSLPKGDKMAEIAHNFKCKKSVVRGGLHLPGKK